MAALRIGELLVKEGLVTPSQLQAALTAQQVFGGRLGTNLVEHGFVNEVDLARLLSQQLGIQVVEPHELAAIDPRIIALLPADLARKYSVVPFRHDAERGRISLAVADPTNLQKIDEIQFSLGKTVDFFISPEILLSFALEKYYGVERTRRYVRLSGVAEAEMPALGDETSSSRPRAPRKPRGAATRGGLAREEVLGAIIDAPSKQQLVASVTDALEALAEQVVFFVLRGQELVAWEARGVPVDEDRLRAVKVSLDGSPALEELLAGPAPRALDALGRDDTLRDALEGSLFVDGSRPLLLLPLLVNRKPFGVFVLGEPAEGVAAGQLPVLAELMKRVSYRLQVFILMEYLSAPL